MQKTVNHKNINEIEYHNLVCFEIHTVIKRRIKSSIKCFFPQQETYLKFTVYFLN